MLDKFIFENHLGLRFVGLENSVFLNYSNLRDYSWNYDTINNRISRFYMGMKKRKIPLTVKCSSDEEAIAVLNRLHELAEADIEAKIPGKVIVGDYYTTGYITASAKSNYLVSKQMCNIELTLTSDDPAWYSEKTYVFGGGGSSGDEPEVPDPDEPESGGIVPTGTMQITENGLYDVLQYATVDVNVEPEGEGNIHATSVSYVKDGNTITETSTLDNGTIGASTITLDENGYPVSVVGDKTMNIAIAYDESGYATSVTVDGESVPISWEGF